MAGLGDGLELGGILETRADVGRDEAEWARDEERNAPAVGLHRLVAEDGREAVCDDGSDEQAGDRNRHEQRGGQATALGAAVLRDIGGHGTDLAAGG